MQINTDRLKKLLKSFDFKAIFIEELGWDNYSTNLNVSVDGNEFSLHAVAEKRGMAVFLCKPSGNEGIPDYSTRRKIEKQAARTVHEHIIIYTDSDQNKQIWQWVKREAGKPTACREHTCDRNQPGDSLVQKINQLEFSLEEETDLTIVHVAGRARKAFDVEKVTKRFYDRFKTEHGKFLKFLKGIPDDKMQRWYVSVMLNRLMFIYFMQKKEFLDNNTDYLLTKLEQSKQLGRDCYYKNLLRPLFFEGFAKKENERSSSTNKLLGKIPYLNGGLFQHHQIEQLYGKDINIKDAAFENIFEFFNQYQWHLDERPLRNDNEINPDVLGYIFEKYINQKQMGAYYTKEDITGYISKNTVIPFLFDKAKKKCKSSFEGDSSVWQLLNEDPDRYIYDAVKHGITVNIYSTPPAQFDKPMRLPDNISEGVHNVSKRTEWNKPAPEEYALPTEIWREVVARRQRYEEVHEKLLRGEIQSINDFITYNLDIIQFAHDVIENCESSELLSAFWHAIEGISILDPTCGSGAFLFAALNVLEPLYEACLDRMQMFLEELEQSGEKHRPEKYSNFRKVLEKVEKRHSYNRRYFIMKSIIINNLYGVDIMEEAIEICKLRMFLKMVAQVEKVKDIEPLPDIDFNIQSGNTLVGFATRDEVKKAIEIETIKKGIQKNLLFGEKVEVMDRIEESAEIADKAFLQFREMQTKREMDAKDFADSKEALKKRLMDLEKELNGYLAKEYGIDSKQQKVFSKWLKSHQPFHWFVEFYGIIKNGGFDVIIGNPPYVEYSKVRRQYLLPKKYYKTEASGNLYAYVMERSYSLANNTSKIGIIVPISLVCTQRMAVLQDLIFSKTYHTWHSIYAERPSKLFTGADVLLSISITQVTSKKENLNFITGLRKWSNDERKYLFAKLYYCTMKKKIRNYILPKITDEIEHSIIYKLWQENGRIGNYFTKDSKHKIFYRIGGGRYWKVFTTFQPVFKLNGADSVSSRQNHLYFNTLIDRDIALALFSSTLFYLYFLVTTNGRDLNPSDLSGFPLNLIKINDDFHGRFSELIKALMNNYKKNRVLKEKESRLTGHISYEEFYPRKAKFILDEIDQLFAKHYGFTDEELDFIINYDIKYRMGSTLNDE